MILPLEQAAEPGRFGGKAAQLGAARAAGLPVPQGVALSWDLVEELAAGDTLRIVSAEVRSSLAGPLAVRSSALGEDSAEASFAGQHRTRLGVWTADELADAILDVHRSARSPGALAYRNRLGLTGTPRIAVVVQRLVDAECAGVLFTRNPLNGTDERVIEAAWGLGEVVVAGLVTPDRYRMDRTGRVLERTSGEKDLALRIVAGGVREQEVEPERVHELCLGAERLLALHDLASRCERVFGGALDLEWAFASDGLHLLQHRPITRAGGLATPTPGGSEPLPPAVP